MATKTRPFIRLRHQDKHVQIAVETEEADRFFVTVGAAIEACKAFGKYQEFTQQFRKLQAKVSAWVAEHEHQIDEAYLTVRDSAILLLTVQETEAFNQELEDSLTALDLELANDDDLNLLRVNVLSLPKASEESIQWELDSPALRTR